MSKEFIEWSYSNDNYDWCCLAHAKAAWDYQQDEIDDLTLEIQHLKEELQVTKDQRSAAFRKIEELLDEMNKE
jgi:formiminotetrahydrofolate cyclodeaminase